MCDDSEKLIAWLDGELPPEEAAEVEAHLRGCAECRSECIAFERTSAAINEYCEAVMIASAPRTAPRRVPVALSAGTAAVVAVIALLIALPHLRRVQLPIAPQPEAAPAVARMTVPPALPSPMKPAHRRRTAAVAQNHVDARPFVQPEIQITIPAEAVLPPGALPEGVNFVSEVIIGPDGLAAPMFVRP